MLRRLTTVAPLRAQLSRSASTLVVADHTNDAISQATLSTMTPAADIGGDITVLVAGEGCAAAADAAAQMAHALNNPLTAIIGNLQLLQDEDENANLTREERKKKYFERADIIEALNIAADLAMEMKPPTMRLGAKQEPKSETPAN